MIHKFNLNNLYIVLDVISGSVHIIDKIVYDIVENVKTMSPEKIIDAYSGEYSEKDINSALKEIQELIDMNLLYGEAEELNIENYNDKNIIKAMCLHVAHDCNLKCKYCFASQGNFNGESMIMDYDTGKRALDFLVENSGNRKNLEVDFFGGEPLMNFKLVKDLVSYGRSIEQEKNKNFRFTITTNGVLLDDENIDFINEHMDNVVLSLDGRRLVNDEMRPTANNKSSYDEVVPKFQKLVSKRGDKNYYIRGTFTNKNLDFSKDLLEYYNLGFKSTSIEPVVTDPREEYAIREEHLEQILKEYEEMSEEYLKIRSKDPDFLFFHFMVDLNQGPCIYKRSIGCGAGSEYVAITPKGDIYPCHQFVGNEDFLLGDIFNGIHNDDLRTTFKNSNVESKEECQTCWAKFYCSGGCHANAYHENHDLLKPYKVGCEMEKKRLECAISIIANESLE